MGVILGLVAVTTGLVLAVDGSGTNTVSPLTTTTSSTGNTFTFTFTAAETMDRGEVVINIPTATGNWSTPQGTSGTAGYTTVSTTGSNTVAKVLNTADSATDWIEVGGTDVCNTISTPTADTTNKQEGSASIECSNSGSNAPDVNDAFVYDLGADQDWSNFDQVGFWFRSSVSISATGQLAFRYYSTNSTTTAIESFDVYTLNGSATLNADTWYWLKPTLTATRTQVRTFGIASLSNTAGSGLDSRNVWIDDILLGYTSSSAPSGAVTFNDQDSNGTTDIRVRFIDLASLATVTITYGSGGGTSGVTAPSAAATYTFTTKTRVDDLTTNSLASILVSPTIVVALPSPVLTQNDFEIFVDNDTLTPADEWPSGSLATGENGAVTALPVVYDPLDPTDEIRIRMNVAVSTANLDAGGEGFSLQYKESNDCTDGTSWSDVDAGGGGGTWRFATSGITDNTTLTTLKISTSDVAGRYNKSDPSSTNPNLVLIGQNLEWDWHVEYNGDAAAHVYCFRMINDAGSALNAYNADSYPKIETRPGIANLLRHGEFFSTGTEKGFFWAD